MAIVTTAAGWAAVLALGVAVVASGTSPSAVRASDGALATDSFSREVADAWGSANPGGTYRVTGPSDDFSVDGSTGAMVLRRAGMGLHALLAGARGLDVDMPTRPPGARRAIVGRPPRPTPCSA